MTVWTKSQELDLGLGSASKGREFSPSTFAIFEAFPDAAARHAHDAGPGGQNFFQRSGDLHGFLAHPAQLYRVDVLHGKYDVLFGKKVSSE